MARPMLAGTGFACFDRRHRDGRDEASRIEAATEETWNSE
jgi:hypothetical protein